MNCPNTDLPRYHGIGVLKFHFTIYLCTGLSSLSMLQFGSGTFCCLDPSNPSEMEYSKYWTKLILLLIILQKRDQNDFVLHLKNTRVVLFPFLYDSFCCSLLHAYLHYTQGSHCVLSTYMYRVLDTCQKALPAKNNDPFKIGK